MFSRGHLRLHTFHGVHLLLANDGPRLWKVDTGLYLRGMWDTSDLPITLIVPNNRPPYSASNCNFFWFDYFLDASTHLYKRVCPSVRGSVTLFKKNF